MTTESVRTWQEQWADSALPHYLETALWSSTGDDDEPLDADFGAEDIAPESVASAREELAGFLAYVAECHPESLDELASDPARAGHDFWLTRNGHGAGFWDGDWEHGTALTKASKTFGSSDAYVGDDGSIRLT